MKFERKEKYNIEDMREIMRILRSEDGCPWDRVQTHESIRKNLIEETYEVVEAIDQNDPEMLREELGDVLLQVIFHSQMEEEKSVFSFDDVVNEICQKLIVRHPHIFGNVTVSGVDDVLNNWNAIKQETKGQTTAAETLHSVPKQLPALMRTEKVQSRAKKANSCFGYADVDAAMKDFTAETAELREAIESGDTEAMADELGDVLFAAVNVARKLDADPEELLTRSCDKFIDRFEKVENGAREKGILLKDAQRPLLDELWKKAKE